MGLGLQRRGPGAPPYPENKNRHKLSLPWEGPYIVAKVLRLGTYKLKTIDGEVFVNVWNIEQLCRFYP